MSCVSSRITYLVTYLQDRCAWLTAESLFFSHRVQCSCFIKRTGWYKGLNLGLFIDVIQLMRLVPAFPAIFWPFSGLSLYTYMRFGAALSVDRFYTDGRSPRTVTHLYCQFCPSARWSQLCRISAGGTNPRPLQYRLGRSSFDCRGQQGNFVPDPSTESPSANHFTGRPAA